MKQKNGKHFRSVQPALCSSLPAPLLVCCTSSRVLREARSVLFSLFSSHLSFGPYLGLSPDLGSCDIVCLKFWRCSFANHPMDVGFVFLSLCTFSTAFWCTDPIFNYGFASSIGKTLKSVFCNDPSDQSLPSTVPRPELLRGSHTICS